MLNRPGGVADNLTRLDIRALIAPVADLLVFVAATGSGMRLGPAHIASFGIAAVLNYFVKVRGSVVVAGRTADLRLYGHLLVVSLLALFLRGGVLGLLANVWGWPAQVAILFAVAATVGVTLPGYALALGSSTWTIGSGTRWRTLAVGLVGAAFLLRLVFMGQMELIPEESYYWNYGQHLDIGYLDHPPMVAWLIRLGTAVFGDTEFGVRSGALGCAAVAAFFAYRLTRNLFGEPSALIALVLMQVLPFFFLAGLLMTPDVPLTAAWAAALYFLERALLAGQGRAWLFAGVCIGLGLISKYTIGMLIPAAGLFVLLDKPSRRWLLRWEPYAALLLCLAIFSPVIIWNAQHEWASFAFQTARRLAERPRFAFHKLILSMLVLLTPTGFLTLLVSRFSRRSEADSMRPWLFIRVFALVPLAVFVVFSLRHDVKIDWTGTLWLAAVPALAAAILLFGQRGTAGVRAWAHSAWGPTAITLLLVYGAGLHYLALGLPGVGYSQHLELVPVGWRDLGRQINMLADDIRKSSGAEPVIVGMDRYELASQLTFYAPDRARSVRETSSRNLFGEEGLMYDRWASSLVTSGRTLLLVAWDRHDISDELTAPYVESLEPLREGVLTRDGTVIRNYCYRLAHGLKAAK
jgi:dolichol-phosphate mannosyltransferase